MLSKTQARRKTDLEYINNVLKLVIIFYIYCYTTTENKQINKNTKNTQINNQMY